MTAPEESDTVPSSLPVAAADCACPKGDDSDKARANKKVMHKKRVETDDCAMHFFMIWAPVWPNYTQLKRYCCRSRSRSSETRVETVFTAHTRASEMCQVQELVVDADAPWWGLAGFQTR